MNKNEMIETVKTMIAAPSCCKELRAAGKNWLNALGTSGEKAAAEALLAEIKDDVTPIDHMVEFFDSPARSPDLRRGKGESHGRPCPRDPGAGCQMVRLSRLCRRGKDPRKRRGPHRLTFAS